MQNFQPLVVAAEAKRPVTHRDCVEKAKKKKKEKKRRRKDKLENENPGKKEHVWS